MTVAWQQPPSLVASEPARFDCRPSVDPDLVLMFAARQFGAPVEELLSRRHQAHLVKARAFMVWALRTLGRKRSYPEIGRLMGGRNHAGVIRLHRSAILFRLSDPHFDGACRRLAHRFLETTEAIDVRS